MAEEKKEERGGESSSGYDSFANIFFWILFVLVAISVLNMGLDAIHVSLSFPDFTNIFSVIFNQFQVFSIFFSLMFFIGIIYFNFKLGELSSHGHSPSSHGTHTNRAHSAPAPAFSHTPDKRWQNILSRISSSNEADWRLAIIEADIILNDMLGRMGYHGESIAEKLKQVEKSDFKTLQSAWEAHKVRNEIAHAGSSYHLSKREAERTIALFKEVFEEFFFI